MQSRDDREPAAFLAVAPCRNHDLDQAWDKFWMPVMRRGYQRLAKWIDGVAGVLFIGFGLHLIFSRS